MSGSVLAVVLIPIVVAAALFVFIWMVFHADRHPRQGRGGAPNRTVTGGIFRGDPRQQVPHRDAPPKEAAAAEQGGRGRGTQEEGTPE
jgi:hypothetical protein